MSPQNFQNNLKHVGRVMLHKLTGANHKGNWQHLSPDVCAARCLEEYEEYVEAYNKKKDSWDVQLENADVANFAMFLYNNLDDTFPKQEREAANIAGIRNFLVNLQYVPYSINRRKKIRDIVNFTQYGFKESGFDTEDDWKKELRRLCILIGSSIVRESDYLDRYPAYSKLPPLTKD